MMNAREWGFLVYTFFLLNLGGWAGYCAGVLHERSRKVKP